MTRQRAAWFRSRRNDISPLELALIAMAAACIMLAIVEAVR